MKKTFALLLALALMLSLAACGDKKDDKTPPDSDTPQSSQPQQQGGKPASTNKPADGQSAKDEDFTVPEVDASKRTTDLTITTLKMGKKTYTPGEAITVTLKWTGAPDSSAWVGIVPADIPHGDEYVNDDADIAYIYLEGNEGDQFVFDDELGEALKPGMYTMRVNEDDGGGAELAWCTFAVSGTPAGATQGEDNGDDVEIKGEAWPENEFTAQVPKPRNGVVDAENSTEFGCSISLVMTEEEVAEYAADLIAAGFEGEWKDSSKMYSGKNSEGYKVSLMYNGPKTICSISKE